MEYQSFLSVQPTSLIFIYTVSNITEQITTLSIHTYFTVCVSHL